MIIITNETDSVVIPRGLGPNANGGSVDSVNGKVGEVVLDAEDVHALPDSTTIPTKTSELTNDSGFIGEEALEDYAKVEDVPTKTSDLTNDSGFLTEHQSLTAYTKTSEFATINGQSITGGGNIEVGAPEVPVFNIAEDEETGEYYLVEGAETVFNAVRSGDTRYILDGITYIPEGLAVGEDYVAVIFIDGERLCDIEIYLEDGEYVAEIDNLPMTGTEPASATQLGLVRIGSGISVADDGTISVEGGGSGNSSVFLYNGMPNDDVVAIYNDIMANTEDGLYKGDKIFYALDESGRVSISTIRVLQNFDGGDWIQMFAFTYQDGSRYRIDISIKYNYSSEVTTFEYWRFGE